MKFKGEILLFTLVLYCCGYWYATHMISFMSQMTADIFSFSNTTGDTSGAGDIYPSGTPKFIPGICGDHLLFNL